MCRPTGRLLPAGRKFDLGRPVDRSVDKIGSKRPHTLKPCIEIYRYFCWYLFSVRPKNPISMRIFDIPAIPVESLNQQHDHQLDDSLTNVWACPLFVDDNDSVLSDGRASRLAICIGRRKPHSRFSCNSKCKACLGPTEVQLLRGYSFRSFPMQMRFELQLRDRNSFPLPKRTKTGDPTSLPTTSRPTAVPTATDRYCRRRFSQTVPRTSSMRLVFSSSPCSSSASGSTVR